MDIIEKIEKLRKERGWTIYMLASEAGLTNSTISSIYSRNTPPKIETLQAICDGFGITLAQFFLEEEQIEILTVKEREFLSAYRKLPNAKQKALYDFIKE